MKMRKALAVVLGFVGVLIVLGSIGQGDYETIVQKTAEITPLWQLALQVLGGLVPLGLAVLLWRNR